ncbi:MAG: protein-L-isoaspartate O-methyltransferase [Pseudomonadota bacterium]
MIDYTQAREAMVDCQIRPADVTRYSIIEAFLAVPREAFVGHAMRDVAYADIEVPLAPGRVLVEPRTLAKMIEVVGVSSGDLVLDLAPGTGYSTAILARLAEAVVAIEPEQVLLEQMQDALANLEVDNAVAALGSPAQGDAAHGPYDVIFVNGAVETLPASLTSQLKDGGRLVAVFLDGSVGRCCVMVRAGESLTDRFCFNATAPLLQGFEKDRSFAF